jgi:tetratricopeptide (TPR) repeat protein
MSFEPIKNRDAWSTIRGYVYQVDTTIMRWLNLKNNEILELEKGEDIDIVRGGLESGQIERELEQVKHREGNLTLNTDFVLEALLNFFTHKKNNASTKLLFRFVTNTSYATERPSIFPTGQSAIGVWIELNRQSIVDENDNRLTKIRTHLVRKIEELIEKTKDDDDLSIVGKTHLEQFRTFLNTPSAFLSFVKEVEWSTENSTDVDLSDDIKKQILDLNLVGNTSESKILYARLFHYVFALLSTKGEKFLDKTALQEQAKFPQLSDSASKMLTVISEFLSLQKEKVQELETKLNVTRDQVVKLVNDVNIIQTTEATFGYSLRKLSLEPPLLIRNGAPRSEKVKELLVSFQHKKWLALSGINGTGKTQLASIICRHFSHTIWIDLRSLNTNLENSNLIIRGCIEKFVGLPDDNTKDWVGRAVKLLPENSIVVINDLPKLQNEHALSDLLVVMFTDMTDTCLITTSNFQLPIAVQESIGLKLINEYSDLDFIEDEIKEYLNSNAAPQPILDQTKLILVISGGNARIVASIIQFLKKNGWTDSTTAIKAMIEREFEKSFIEDVQNSIKKYIVDPLSRDLLYRLSFIHWSFYNSDVKAIAELDIAISYPNEKLLDVLHLWVQQTNDGYLLSPLAYDIGGNNLPQNLIEQIHLTLARTIFQTKSLDQITATRCITEFIAGRDFNNAGLVYLTVLQSAKSKREIETLNEWGYLNYWKTIDMPSNISVFIRAYVRHEQIKIAGQLGKGSEEYFKWLAVYETEGGLSISERMFVVSFKLINWKPPYTEQYWNSLNYLFDNYKDVTGPFSNVIRPETLIIYLWIAVPHINSAQTITKWLEAFERIRRISASTLLETPELEQAIFIIGQKIVDAGFSNRSDGNRQTISVLEIFRKGIERTGSETLTALVSSFLVKAEFRVDKDISRSEQAILDLEKQFQSNGALYFLYDVLGKLYFDLDKQSSARFLFKAIDTGYRPKTYFIETLVFAACAFSISDKKRTIELFEQALSFAKASSAFDVLDEIQMLGELGIAYWENRDYPESLQCFETAVTKLLEFKKTERNKTWYRYFLLMGHCLGYIPQDVRGLSTPEFTMESEEYFRPNTGLFVFNESDLESRYKEKNVPIISVQLARYAEALGQTSKAYDWTIKAFDQARVNGDQTILLMITGICGQYFLANFKLTEAFESYLLFAAVSTYAKGDVKTRHEMLGSIDLNLLFQDKPSEIWNNAEDVVVSFFVAPVLMQVMTLLFAQRAEAQDRHREFTKLLTSYNNAASDSQTWLTVTDLCTRILDKRISARELQKEIESFRKNDRKNLIAICTLGIIFVSKENETRLKQIVNIVPYLLMLNSQWESIISTAIVPFVKNIAIMILRAEFFGAANELQLLLDQISSIDNRSKNATKLVLRPVVMEMGVALPEDRTIWLNSLD